MKYFKKIEKKKWFKQFKKNELRLRPDNRIELGKFCYEKDFQLPSWLLGIGLGLFASVNISGILNSNNIFIYWSGLVAYILSPVLLLIGIFLLIKNVNDQKIKMTYLYTLKEKNKK